MHKYSGIIDDPRKDLKVINGWSVDEVLPQSASFEWKKKDKLKSYPVWNQAGSSACVAFSKAKQLSIKIFILTGVWIDFSPASIYQLRINQGQLGMHIPNANEIVAKRGATLEALMKSQNLTEDQINTVKRTKVADLFAKAIAEAVVAYFYFPQGTNIDRLAQALEAGKNPTLLVYGTYAEWSKKVPVILDSNVTYEGAEVRHEVVCEDYYLNKNGVKCLKIGDSAHFGGYTEREVTEDFFNKRCILSDVIETFSFEGGEGDKPKYDGSIISVQRCLKYEGLLAVEVPEIENFGPLTQQAIMKFQVRYGLHPTGVPNIGPMTRAKLQELYS